MPECRACRSADVRLLFDLGSMPLAGGFLDGRESIAGEQRFPLSVHLCHVCALVQIVDPVDPAKLFHDYSFSSSTIPALVSHFEDYAGWLVDRFNPRTVVEFGCNDGVLLGPLKAHGVVVAGVDLSDNICALARAKGYDVTMGAFTPSVAEALCARLGPADVVTGSNAFAHNADPEAILSAADAILSADGRLCLEVMYAGDLFEQLQWDTLYHEHLTFYGLSQLKVLLGRNGFDVEHVARMPMHSGSLRLVAARTGRAQPDGSVAAMLSFERDLGIDRPESWYEFVRRSRRTIEVVTEVLGDMRRHRRIWAYGASGRATMWVNACGLDYLEGVVDASPLRAGKLMPGTHTPIVSPEEFKQAENPGLVFVTAWNYLGAIRAKESWYEGLWVTPVPSLTFV
jgi:SAM-dependent methyltransferase